MKAFPYGSNPKYYEFDIGFTKDGYYCGTGGRGVGRVVVFTTGMGPSTTYQYDEAYGNDWFAVYTDDHYASFQEYYNNGTYSERFKAEGYLAAYQWSSPTTITNTIY